MTLFAMMIIAVPRIHRIFLGWDTVFCSTIRNILAILRWTILSVMFNWLSTGFSITLSWTWPPVRMRTQGHPSLSTTARILVDRPPRLTPVDWFWVLSTSPFLHLHWLCAPWYTFHLYLNPAHLRLYAVGQTNLSIPHFPATAQTACTQSATVHNIPTNPAKAHQFSESRELR